MSLKVKCVSPYKSSLGTFRVGDVIDNEKLAIALKLDSPGSFEDVPEVEAIAPPDGSPEDKMIKKATKKAVGDG